ncbi:MAG: type transport system ATP-binding protein [Thermoplasmata archaeon]|nr:type transport system ATP-binding protein [Thermoplasmata archaeon]
MASPARPVSAARPAPSNGRPGSDAVIEVRDLVKQYKDGTQAVKGISFSVRKGEIFGFLGPNGAGKTTTMRILGTLHHQTSGTAKVLGLDLPKHSNEVQKRIGFAMQEIGMDELATAREMLVLHARLYGIPKKEAVLQAEELLKTFDLAEHADRRVTRFSGGMQRRLDLAVSLIHTPEVLFLDEPSTGLDPKSRSDLWRVLRKLQAQGITMLLSTHYMEEADELCDRIAIIHAGRIAAIDTPENLKRSVGADTVRITLGSQPTDTQRRALDRAFGAHNVSFQDGNLDLRVKDGGKALLPALQVVADQGIAVRETRVLTPTLEDVFLQYTGARFSEAQKAAEAPKEDEKGRKGKDAKSPAAAERTLEAA